MKSSSLKALLELRKLREKNALIAAVHAENLVEEAKKAAKQHEDSLENYREFRLTEEQERFKTISNKTATIRDIGKFKYLMGLMRLTEDSKKELLAMFKKKLGEKRGELNKAVLIKIKASQATIRMESLHTNVKLKENLLSERSQEYEMEELYNKDRMLK